MTDVGPCQSIRMVTQSPVRLYIGRRFQPSVRDLSMRWRVMQFPKIQIVIETKDVVHCTVVRLGYSVSLSRLLE